MAMKITEECVACGSCLESCPTDAVIEGEEIFSIDAAKCVDCEGHFDEPQCASVCPSEAVLKA